MKSVTLKAYPRSLTRRPGTKKLRESGRVPAVIYGRQQAPQNLEVLSKDLDNILHHSASETVLVDLSVADDARPKRLALVQEIQHHPLNARMLHVDLHEVAEDEKVTINVAVETVGDCIGVKNGGVLEHVLFKLKVCGLPKDLPEALVVDVTNLEVDKVIHIGEIQAPAGTEIIGDKSFPVIACATPKTEEEAAADAEVTTAATADVEMIKEKKEDGAPDGEKAPAGDKKAEKAPAAAADKKAPAAPAAAEKAKKK
jgi:large subunit ribosomal protein L25